MKKTNDVTIYYDRSTPYPAINVKVHNFPDSSIVVDKFNCDDSSAEAAIGFAWDEACEMFWETAKEYAIDTLSKAFGDYMTSHKTFDVYSLGKSGGWLVVDGLPDIEDWTADQLKAWDNFEKRMQALLKDVTSVSRVLAMIAENEWYKPGSESHNFIERADGTSVSIPELKEKAIKDGYGDIIR